MALEKQPLPPEDTVAVEDILAAMRQGGVYLDVSPSDVLAVYRLAWDHAIARLGRDIPVAAFMTRDVAAVTVERPVHEAVAIMADRRVSGLPVLQDGRVVGVVSTKDLLRLLGMPASAGPATLLARLLDPNVCSAPSVPTAGQQPVSAVMTAPAIIIAPDRRRSEAAAIMAAHGINRLPVCDGPHLCGIVSRGDVVRTCRNLAARCGV